MVTELKAIKFLTGATAVPVAAGGVDGAEGAVTLVISGEDVQVRKAIACIEGVKGAKIARRFRQTDCTLCDDKHCSLRGGTKPWLNK